MHRRRHTWYVFYEASGTLVGEIVALINPSQANPRSLKDLLPQLSVWSMSFRTYNFADDPDLPKMPSCDGFVGWEDRAHMAKFTKHDRAVLHGAQKEMGLPLSKFE